MLQSTVCECAPALVLQNTVCAVCANVPAFGECATEHTGRESKPVNQRALLQSMTHAHVLAVDISLNTGSVLLQSMLVELLQSIVERQVGNRCSSMSTSTGALFSRVLLQSKPCASELCQRALGRRALCRRALLNNKKSCEC